MDAVENVDLAQLTADVATQLIDEKRRSIAGLVKQMLQRAEQLAADIKKLEKEAQGKRGQLAQALAKIEKLRVGDWSVLEEPKRQGGSPARGAEEVVEMMP